MICKYNVEKVMKTWSMRKICIWNDKYICNEEIQYVLYENKKNGYESIYGTSWVEDNMYMCRNDVKMKALTNYILKQ